MLSVAQAVHHPETPGSTSKHSTLGHTWSSERPNVLKRRKTEPECYATDKKSKINNSAQNLTKHYPFDGREITLTVIPKGTTQNAYKELFVGTIKTSVIEKKELILNDENQEENEESVLSFLENSEEIQLTKLGSNENIKLTNQNDIISDCLQSKDSTAKSPSYVNKATDTLEQKNNFFESNSIAKLSEVTIEPCSFYKSKVVKSSSDSTIKKITKTESKLKKAQELLKKKAPEINRTFNTSHVNESFDIDLKVSQPEVNQTFDHDDKSNETISDESLNKVNYITPDSSLFVERNDLTCNSSICDYEPFNVGIPCDHLYINDKDKLHYTTGFPNPPGENRCWVNATLQALFALPAINKLDSLHIPDCSKLMSSLINVQILWRKGNTGNRIFDQTFNTFKEELSVLDKLYSSKAQQDVSEFVMNLLNYIKIEFETTLSKKFHSNEIENIPNNEQNTLRKPHSVTHDSNKRLPLADISASAGQPRNNHLTTLDNQQDFIKTKTNSSLVKSKCDKIVESSVNPIDEFFSLYMIETYICGSCSKQREQKVENLMLFIDLPSEDNNTRVNLVEMINTTYALEHRNITCEACKHDSHSMVTKFTKLPKVLIVQVKRYEMTNDGIITKKSTLVEVPRLLKIDSLVLNNQDFDYFPSYEPTCIISHIGDNIDSGHYISFVKHQDQWFYYDDSNVKLLSADEVFKCIQNNAYVIFYQDTELSENITITNDDKNKKESITC